MPQSANPDLTHMSSKTVVINDEKSSDVLVRQSNAAEKKPLKKTSVKKVPAVQVKSTVSAERLAKLRTWGGGKIMSASEAIMWRMEVLPKTRSTGTSLHILEGTPDWSRFMATMEWMVAVVPRLRQKVFETGVIGQLPSWVDDESFSLHYHVRRVSLPGEGAHSELMSFLESFSTTPCDRSRSPWEIVLIEGLENKRSAFAMKIHHSMTDGAGLIQLFDALLARTADEQLSPVAKWEAKKPLWRRQVGGRLLTDFRQFSTLASSAGRQAYKWISDRETEFSRMALDYSRSIMALTQAQSGGGSPLFRKRSLATRIEIFELPFPALKAAAKNAGASFNDVYLAGIIGGFRRYHEAYDISLDAVPLSFPVSVRKPGDPEGGNRFSGVSYRAPVYSDLNTQLKEVGDFVSQVRQEPAIDFFNQLMPGMLAMPNSVIAALMSLVTSRMDAQASNIPGMRETVYLSGCKVLAHYAIPPRPGCAVMYAMITHDDKACIALNIDPAAIVEPQLLIDSVTAEFNEIINQFSNK
jgi:WS/DGAT/MGAT family acyltransferase